MLWQVFSSCVVYIEEKMVLEGARDVVISGKKALAFLEQTRQNLSCIWFILFLTSTLFASYVNA